ncbi:MAG: hypothetical protein WD712_02325 [Candidatus Spechtbacterales bacterium]
MRKSDFEFKYLGSCPSCEAGFGSRDASVINKKSDLSQIYAQCPNCKSSVSVFVFRSNIGFITTVGILTDMQKEDILRLKKAKPITADDVLELHKFLESS